METIAKKFVMTKVNDVILIVLSDDIEIMFNKVFEWPDSNGIRIGKLNIWDKHAPFSIVFNKDQQTMMKKKGFKGCYSIPNLFEYTFDKNKQLLLKCVSNITNNKDITYCKLKYYRTSSMSELRNLVSMKRNGHEIYGGSPNSYGCISVISEAFEISKL